MVIVILQFIINIVTAIFDFIVSVIQSIAILIWQNFFHIIISFVRKILLILFRHSTFGYKTEEKIRSAKKELKKKSKFDRDKIIRNT